MTLTAHRPLSSTVRGALTNCLIGSITVVGSRRAVGFSFPGMVAEVCERTGNAVITPGGILLGHAGDQLLRVGAQWRPA